MEEEIADSSQEQPRWFIDSNWYQQNHRSLSTLIQHYLCPNCRDRLTAKEDSETNLLRTIKACCSQTPGFISPKLTIMESIFRLFMMSGNQPLTLDELSRELGKWREGDTYRTSPEMLSRLLRSDRYYGLRPVQG